MAALKTCKGQVSQDAHETLDALFREQGINLGAFLEAYAERVREHPEEVERGSAFKILARAREIAYQRRRRKV